MTKKYLLCSGICLVSLLCLLSCGLETLPFIDYIPQSTYKIEDGTRARINLPSSGDEGYNTYFTHFIIFYRIYISSVNHSGIVAPLQQANINTRLQRDFNDFYPYTDFTSKEGSSSNIETLFNNKGYYKLSLERTPNSELDTSSVLNDNVLGRSLDIRFFQNNGENPTLTVVGGVNAGTYILKRANYGGPNNISFIPRPDRYFLNTEVHTDGALCDNSLAVNPSQPSKNENADVYGFSPGNDTPSKLYTFVSMYIVATGRDFITQVYSPPTHIGIFRLAEAF